MRYYSIKFRNKIGQGLLKDCDADVSNVMLINY